MSATKGVTSARHNCVLMFDHVTLNAGSAYDATTGIFTAPSDGVYVFHLDVQSPRGTLSSVDILHNENPVHHLWGNGRNTGDRGVASGTVALQLAVGDQVYAKLVYDNGYTFAEEKVSRFTGYKLG